MRNIVICAGGHRDLKDRLFRPMLGIAKIPGAKNQYPPGKIRELNIVVMPVKRQHGKKENFDYFFG
jgi:hypothetical protein